MPKQLKYSVELVNDDKQLSDDENEDHNKVYKEDEE